MPAPAYKLGDSVATREAYGTALAALGGIDRRIVALDADVKNSTFSERFEKAHPGSLLSDVHRRAGDDRRGDGARRRAARFRFRRASRASSSARSDFIRMAGISNLNVKLAGSHAGVSIGEDGPSQMALEDLAMMRGVPNCTVLYPCDAVSAERLMALAAATPGPVYIRTSRPKTPVIYDAGRDVHGRRLEDAASERRATSCTVVAAGVTVFEALKAHDHARRRGHRDSRDRRVLGAADRSRRARRRRQRATGGRIITVEDHYAHGGLGDAVSEAVWDRRASACERLAVREIPRSGTAGRAARPLRHLGARDR